MATLHLINRTCAFASCQALLSEQDALLLIEDAVLLLAEQGTVFKENQHRLYFLKADLDARGLSLSSKGVAIIDYDQMVELTLKFDKTISW